MAASSNPTSPGGGGGELCRSSSTVGGTAAGNTVTVSNVSGTALANVGSAALVQAGGNNILVIQTAQGSFSAFTAVCTHEQNIITGFQSNTRSCVRLTARSSTRAAVSCRARRRERFSEFPTQFTNNVLTITV